VHIVKLKIKRDKLFDIPEIYAVGLSKQFLW